MSVSGMKALGNRMIAEIDGEKIEYTIAGTGLPTVVLINGAGGPIEGWYKVYQPISQLGTVIAYNRAGIGRSSKPARAQTGEFLVKSLHNLLNQVGLMPPYILVGHSLGGLIANLYARTYPATIAGVVFLEATTPDDVALMAKQETVLQSFLKQVAAISIPKDKNAEVMQVAQIVDEIAKAGPFPEMPLIVVSGAKHAMAWATPRSVLLGRARNQENLAKLSPKGIHIVAQKSGHFPQFSQPEVVIDAVRQAIAGYV